MIAVVFSWLCTMAHAFKAAIEPSRCAQQRSLHASLFFSLLVFWIIGLTHDVLYHPSVALMFFGVVGWIMSQCENSEEREIE